MNLRMQFNGVLNKVEKSTPQSKEIDDLYEEMEKMKNGGRKYIIDDIQRQLAVAILNTKNHVNLEKQANLTKIDFLDDFLKESRNIEVKDNSKTQTSNKITSDWTFPFFKNEIAENYFFGQNPLNKLNFKASSLYRKALLFESELVQITVDFSLTQNFEKSDLKIKLTYFPKIFDLVLSVNVYNVKKDQIDRQFIQKCNFKHEIEQTITLSYKLLVCQNFPTLHLELELTDKIVNMDVLVPTTINKFIDFQKTIDEECFSILNQLDFENNKVLTFEISFNQIVVPQFSDFKQIFENSMILADGSFLVFLHFPGKNKAFVQISNRSEQAIHLLFYAEFLFPEFELFIEWFLYIFGDEGIKERTS